MRNLADLDGILDCSQVKSFDLKSIGSHLCYMWSRRLNREQKEIVVKELSQIFSDSGVVVIAHYSGLTVSDMSELRNRMRDAESGVRVAKNRLAKIALEGKKNSGLVELLEGQYGFNAFRKILWRQPRWQSSFQTNTRI